MYITERCVLGFSGGKDLPNMSKFCDWISETKVISVHDSFF